MMMMMMMAFISMAAEEERNISFLCILRPQTETEMRQLQITQVTQSTHFFTRFVHDLELFLRKHLQEGGKTEMTEVWKGFSAPNT